jgi:DNA-directed RNA polymerase subunit E'/Rpb7
MGFFPDIRIAPEMLPAPHRYHPDEREWSWQVGDGELFFERGQRVRFRVQRVRFAPVPTLQEQQERRERGQVAAGTAERPHVPMLVEGRADTEGLGMLMWGWE